MKILGYFTAALLLFGCAAASVGTEADAQQAIAAAKAAHKKANSLQGGWVSTGKLIKKAEAAAAKGDAAAAMKLASQARAEADLAYAQAENEQKHWSPPGYLSR